ncbi:alpha/beta-hydrolase [Dentipellis sp. KUC8613]|nr:alpha/beta-hydrolase [Dentipellis sp. KUC8613]
MSTEQPFKISVSDDALALLKHKLQQVRFPDELDDAGWDYGVPLAPLKRLVSRWANGYNWRDAEAKFNALPQFTRDIAVKDFGTLNIHYIHQKSNRPNAIPLLFVHGWPGSFIEVTKILPLLVNAPDDKPSFHVVAVSLPNFGFSEGVRKKGFAVHQYAEVGHKLMLALGYNEYVTQGGDWGHFITNMIAMKYGPQHIKAWHTNFPKTSPPADTALEGDNSEVDTARLEHNELWAKGDQGYYAQLSSKPQTIGYALADSPVALLAWIYEKLVGYSDAYDWQDDEVLTWISIYWFSRAGPGASGRIYYEFEHADQVAVQPRPTIPFGVSYFPKEVMSSPLSWASGMGNVVFQSQHSKGGHFAAYEQPEALVDDLRRMYGRGGPAFAVVPGKTGY